MFEELSHVFKGHGVPDAYLDSWFSNYECDGDSQIKAFEKIKEAYKHDEPMIFLGKFGGGKTHLATAMVKSHLVYRREAYYYTMSTLFAAYRSSLSDPDLKESSFWKKIEATELLVVDELNLRSNSEAENRIFQQIVDLRYSYQLQTIFVANMGYSAFSELLGERLMDRLKEQETKVIKFNWESHRGKK